MNKYRAKKTIVDNIQFDSLFEAKVYKDLKLLENLGQIKDLELQPKFLINEGEVYNCNFTKKGKTKIAGNYYTPDFKYRDSDGSSVVVEAKGMKTEAYQLRKKLFLKRILKTGKCDRFAEMTKIGTKIYQREGK